MPLRTLFLIYVIYKRIGVLHCMGAGPRVITEFTQHGSDMLTSSWNFYSFGPRLCKLSRGRLSRGDIDGANQKTVRKCLGKMLQVTDCKNFLGTSPRTPLPSCAISFPSVPAGALAQRNRVSRAIVRIRFKTELNPTAVYGGSASGIHQASFRQARYSPCLGEKT